MAEYSFTVERFSQVRQEAAALFHEQYALMDCDRDAIPLDPDYDELDAACAMGRLLFITCRCEGAMVGYYLAVIRPHILSRHSLTSFQIGFYIVPAHRSGGKAVSMLALAIREVRSRGVQRMYGSANLEYQGGRFGRLLELAGFRPIETAFSKIV